eukprot:GEMP01044744.1.p1 GENE.GEMP01044744.1~~GEMP01044744.1.p1  ORF type:complete len:287 (+),score=79.23 GEMP01044744.1:161-1021(+)
MAGERSLIETLRDEVDQLLEAHRSMDAIRQRFLVELECAYAELEPERSSMLDVLDHGHNMLSEEVEDQNELEALASQIQYMRIRAENKGIASSGESSFSAPSQPLTAVDVSVKVDEARRRRHEREAKAADIGFYNKMNDVVETNARSGLKLSQKANALIAQCEKTRDEHQALAVEKERLQDTAETTLKEKELVSKNVLELFRKVKSIEAMFKERSRFGAWLCNEHSDETEDVNPSPLYEKVAEGRENLHSLKLQRRGLLLAFQHLGLDPSSDDELSSSATTNSSLE